MKKNKKGFTLIELLAVIVILAIIALIAVPVILGIIDKTKVGAAKSSVLGYIDAVEKSYALAIVKGDKTWPAPDEHGCYEVWKINAKVQSKGTVPSNETKICLNSKNVITSVVGKIDNYNFKYEEGKVIVEGKEENASSEPDSGSVTKTCRKVKSEETSLAIGTEYVCTVAEGVTYTFYVLEDGDSDTSTDATESGKVSLIMNQNIDNTLLAWITANDYASANTDGTACVKVACVDEGPITATKKLNEATSSWLNVDKVSLPTAQQIATVANYETWSESGGNGNLKTVPWLYDYLNGTEHPVASAYGYWTSSPAYNTYFSWFVRHDAVLSAYFVYSADGTGVRPVITISKTELN